MTSRALASLSTLILLTIMSTHSSAQDGAKRVALVFDDGPVPEQAVKLLQIFDNAGVSVTFAQNAKNVVVHPDTSRAMQAAGHEIVNHSYDHRHPSELSDEQLNHEIAGAQAAMAKLLDAAPQWYWPPFLESDARVHAIAKEAGIPVYSYPSLVSSEDWNKAIDADEIRRRATTGVEDGSVILFHEWRQETAEQLPAILAELRRQNCVFLTFSELHRELKANPRGQSPLPTKLQK